MTFNLGSAGHEGVVLPGSLVTLGLLEELRLLEELDTPGSPGKTVKIDSPGVFDGLVGWFVPVGELIIC